MTTQRVCFRFDVDSPLCLRSGVPSLMAVARSRGVPFTFFVHAGRATSRRRVLRTAVTAQPAQERPPALPLTRKLGARGTAEIALRNPRIGARQPGRVAELVDAGHEVGLHGGRNHRSWQDAAGSWNEARVRSEVTWGLARLREAGAAPAGFSSPAWQGSAVVDRVVHGLGFRYVADDHGPGLPALAESAAAPGLHRVATALTGEPGGVGYLEAHRARGHGDARVLDDFRARLDEEGELVVLYDHPFWAGVHDARLVARLVDVVGERGGAVTTMVDSLKQQS